MEPAPHESDRPTASLPERLQDLVSELVGAALITVLSIEDTVVGPFRRMFGQWRRRITTSDHEHVSPIVSSVGQTATDALVKIDPSE